jgi:arsenate reductase
MTEKKYNVLFLCTGNSARSIIAEAVLRKECSDKFNAFSAGSHPKGETNPFAIRVLQEHDYPTENLHSKSWSDFEGQNAPQMDFIITVCDSAASETCPIWIGHPVTAHWGIEDPAAVEGTEIEKLTAFNTALKYLRNQVRQLQAVPVERLDRMTITNRLKEIGQTSEGATTKSIEGN